MLTSREVLSSLCGADGALINISTTAAPAGAAITDDTAEIVFSYTEKAVVSFHFSGVNVIASATFPGEDSYDHFIHEFLKQQAMETPEGCDRGDVVTFTPISDDVETGLAAGYIGAVQYSRKESTVQFIIPTDQFNVYAVNPSNLKERG